MDKNKEVEYSLLLLEKLHTMVSENAKGKEVYEKVLAKKRSNPNYQVNKSEAEIYYAYYYDGRIHSKAAISRCRIELNKSLMEINGETKNG